MAERDELVRRGPEQVVARQRREDRVEGSLVVAARREAGACNDRRDLASQQGDLFDRLRVRGRREQTHEAAFPDHMTVGVELLDAYVVEGDRAMHGRARLGLRHGHGMRIPRVAAKCRRHVGEARRVLRETAQAQDPEHALRAQPQCVLTALLDEVVGARPEEGEVVVGEPFEERGGLVGFVAIDRWRRLRPQRGRRVQGFVPHRGPVCDSGAHVGEHVCNRDLQVRELGGRDAVDLDVQVRLEVHPRVRLRTSPHFEQSSHVVATRRSSPVHDHDHVEPASDDGRDDGVDEERHVVGDDLDHGVRRRPAVDDRHRVRDPDRSDATHGSVPCEEIERHCGASGVVGDGELVDVDGAGVLEEERAGDIVLAFREHGSRSRRGRVDEGLRHGPTIRTGRTAWIHHRRAALRQAAAA